MDGGETGSAARHLPYHGLVCRPAVADCAREAGEALSAERDAMPSGDSKGSGAGKPKPTWRSTLRAASIFLLVSASVAIAFYGLK
jgi:hypothetical protein